MSATPPTQELRITSIALSLLEVVQKLPHYSDSKNALDVASYMMWLHMFCSSSNSVLVNITMLWACSWGEV
jgi:hypothetical protein